MFLSFLLHQAVSVWQLDQTVKPSVDNFGIFGRSVALSHDEHKRMVVGASWESSGTSYRVGCIYVYEYDADQKKYLEKQKLIPQNDNRVIFNNTGSTVKISADGRRIVAGAPYSTVDTFQEVGALCVWDWDDNQQLYIQTKIITPVETATQEDAQQGFGRSLAITMDAKTIASAYYNKPRVQQFIDQQGAVFVTTEKSSGDWTTPEKLTPPSQYAGKRLKFGSDLQFVDASHLVVAVTLFDQFEGPGTCYFSKDSNDHWVLEQNILPDQVNQGKYKNYDFSDYGAPIGMPTQSTLGISASFKSNAPITGAFFLLHKDGDIWDTQNPQIVEFPPDTDLTGISYCDANTFMTHASNVKDPTDPSKRTEAIIIYRRNLNNGQFEMRGSETMYPPADRPALLNFGSDMAWNSDCSAVAIGAFTKYPHDESNPHSDEPSNESRVYIFRNVYDPKADGLSSTAIALITVFCCLIVIGAVALIVFCARKHKGVFKTIGLYKEQLNTEEQ